MAIIGIDLGTTNSLAVAYVEDKVVMIPNVYGEYLTPSIVSIDEHQQVIVGKVAKQRLVTHPENTASLFKRNMGTKKKVSLQKHSYLPEELSAFVVKQLMEDAKAYLHEEIEEIVISVPAYFDNAQRSSTKRIGNILGVKVERLINEPSAASIACHYGVEQDESFIVFDFGGGTLDVSVVDCFDNVVSICAIAGNNQLGGSDFDSLIAHDFCHQNQLDYEDLTTQQQESLLLHSEQAKIKLQESSPVNIQLHLKNQDYSYTLSNEILKELGKPIFEKIISVIADAVNHSGFEKGEIDNIVMVGGSSHMNVVIDFLHHLMNIPVYEGIEKDSMVAKGLGIYVGIKQRSSSIKSLVLTDICPFSLNISVHNHLNPQRSLTSVVIPRNSVLPTTKKNRYQTIRETQTQFHIEVNQGEGVYVDQNTLLTDKILTLPNVKKIQDVDITFIYDINSILCVEAQIMETKEKITFFIGDNDVSNEHMEHIKNASMKLNLNPQIDYIEEQVSRILREASPIIQESLKLRYLEYSELLHRYANNLRKRTIIIKRMEELLSNIQAEVHTCDFFQVDLDDEQEPQEEGLWS